MSKISQWNLRAIREQNVLRLKIAPGRALQLGGEHDRRSPRNKGLLDRLEAENAELRGKVVDLMLNIRALAVARLKRGAFRSTGQVAGRRPPPLKP
jgi:hypothetical protein